MPLLAGLALSIGFAGRVIPLSGVAATSALCVGWQFGEHVEAGLRGEIGLLADRIRDPNFALAAPFAAYVIWRATPEGRLQLALEADAGGVQLASDKLGKTVVGAAQGWAGVEVRAFDQVGFLLLAGGGVAFYLQPPPGESAVQAILGTRAGVVLRF